MRKNKFLSIISSFFTAVFVSLIFQHCSTTSTSMEVLVPAQINIPKHIVKVAVGNRSLPSGKSTITNVLEGFITGETIWGDREGSLYCINGLVNKLNNSPRINATAIEDMEFIGTGTREFPHQLDWIKVENICNMYKVDALILLETFDSNIGIRESHKDKKVYDKKSKRDVIVRTFYADLRININAGWRIYDVKNKIIFDESSFMDEKSWGGKGKSHSEALSNLPSKRSAINDAGIFAGNQYALRISPNWMWTSRSYYIKGHDDFKKAKKYVATNNWSEAIKIWQSLSNKSNSKVAGRASYNMAVASEIEGNLNVAQAWAEKAYHAYGIKKAKSYIIIIKRRINDQQRLKEQMDN